MAEAVFDLAVILIAAKLGGELVSRAFKQPVVLGELAAGVLISPFALGGLHIGSLGPLFETPTETRLVNGIAQTIESTLPVSSEIFFVAQFAAVLLLFEAGLETDRKQFFRYAGPATIVAIGGVTAPFLLGMFATVWFGYASFDSINALVPALFVGAVMTATSVGITARVLADIRRLDTPEGVTILGAAVVDDVLGILVLAVVVGISNEGAVSAGSLGIIFAKAVGFWLGLTALGTLLAPRISLAVLWFKGAGGTLVIALALALLAAAVAETYFGLAMIIGSYSAGLALSATPLRARIEEPLRHANWLIVPLFFTVIGMQVDFGAFGDSDSGGSLSKVIVFTAVICVLAVAAKLFGAGLPALGLGFNRAGATRIGIGMVPRGEVALIIAGIGLSADVVTRQEFGVAVVMTVVTTVLAPVLLVPAFRHGGSGLRKPPETPAQH